MRARWSDSKVFPPNTTKSDARSAPLRSHPSPLARSQFEAHAKKLIENDKPKDRLALVTTVREGIEIVNTAEYPAFLAAFLPAFQKVLETTPPHFEDGPEHKTRNAVLEMMNRLPHNEHLRPHDKLVLGLAMDALKTRRMRKTRSSACGSSSTSIATSDRRSSPRWRRSWSLFARCTRVSAKR